MSKPKSDRSVESDALRRWKLRGGESPLLDARLKYMEVEGVARYVRMMGDIACQDCGFPPSMHDGTYEPACTHFNGRVHPLMLPTQASGRWSTTGPPLVNFPPDCINPACPKAGTEHACDTDLCWSARDIVGPDEGWWFLHYDLDAIEAKWAAADAGDQDDLDAFANGWDIHTITACRGFGIPLPPIRTKALHTSPECADWRRLWTPEWSGGEDRRRHIFKTMRYATQFCINAKGVLAAKDIEKLGLDPLELVRFATRYLKAKPALMARKQQVWDECARKGVSYTWYGRRRRLYGDWNTRAKEGWSHRISGTVTDFQNGNIIKLCAEFPECHLVLNSHDGLTLAFPVSTPVERVMAFARPLVERDVTSPTGHTVKVTASWDRVEADLSHHHIPATI